MIQATMAVLDALPFGASLLDEQGNILYQNAEFGRLTGRSASDSTGRSFFVEFASCDGVAETEAAFRDTIANGLTAGSFLSRFELGDIVQTVKVHLRPLQTERESRTIVMLEPVSGQEELRRALQDLELKLYEVGRIKHEMSSPLMGLIGNAELLETLPEMPEKSRQRVETILSEGRRIGACLQLLSRLGGDKSG